VETEIVDRIEQSIEIAASAERVFALISEPGWFINDDRLVEHTIEQVDDGAHVVHDPVHGSFAFRTVSLDPPHAAAFRWLQSLDEVVGPSTLIEFTITELGAGRVRLTVVESGFAALPGEDNTQGWTTELALVRDAVQPVGS
jgi:uncharacterized protein YndB with AHSA1/START domain